MRPGDPIGYFPDAVVAITNGAQLVQTLFLYAYSPAHFTPRRR